MPVNRNRTVRAVDIDVHAAREKIETGIRGDRLCENVFGIEARDEGLAADRMCRIARSHADRVIRAEEHAKNGDDESGSEKERSSSLAHRRPPRPVFQAATERRARRTPTKRNARYCRPNAAISTLVGTMPVYHAQTLNEHVTAMTKLAMPSENRRPDQT